MRHLFPTRTVSARELTELYRYPDPVPESGYLRANMISTLDGAAAGPDGLSGSIGGPDDRRLLATLRGLSDVIVAGAGTVTAEGYLRPKANPGFAEHRAQTGQHPAPVLAVVTASGRLPEPLLTRPGVVDGVPRLLVLTTSAVVERGELTARLGADAVLACGTGDEVDLPAAIARLTGMGLRRLLCEGGPSLLARVAAAGLLDELCLTLSPTLIGGDGPRVLDGAATRVRLQRVHHLESDDGFIFTRWVRAESTPQD